MNTLGTIDQGLEDEITTYKPGDYFTPGLYEVDNETYHNGQGWKSIVGSSGIKKLLRSPLHYITPDEKDSAALNFGSAYHLRILQPELYIEQVKAAPKCDKRTKEGKAAFEQFQQEAAGKIIITQTESEALDGMAERMNQSETAKMILKNPGYFERSAIFEDPAFKFLGKVRPDFDIPSLGVIVDLKSTRDAGMDDFSRSCGTYGYDVSAAWYVDGMRLATGINYDTFIFIAQEKTPPYAVAIYQADAEFIGIGRQKCDIARAIYNECLYTDKWPGYRDEVQKISLPSWAARKVAGVYD